MALTRALAQRKHACLVGCVVVVCVAGCAHGPPAAADISHAVVQPASTGAAHPPDDIVPQGLGDGLEAFERQQRDAADAAARQGRWADAIWAWDIVLAVKPHDTEIARRRAQAEGAARAAVPERLASARAARTRGDIDTAARIYLEALALAPDNAVAAEAMRELERERVRRFQLGQPSRVVMSRRAPVDGRSLGVETEERNELEHASMLASQGELNGAIATLQPLAGPRRGSPALRALLADLYVRQAEQLAATDRAGAIAALQRSLQVDPNQPQAAQRLRQLRDAPDSASKLPR